MRHLMLGDHAGMAAAGAAALAVLLAIYVAMQAPLLPRMLLYPAVRDAARLKFSYETQDMLVRETPHFIIKFRPQDANMVNMVAQAAETSYQPVTHLLGFAPPGKTLVIIYPNKNELRRAFGWSGNESAMGVYWAGVIEILSPDNWLPPGSAAAQAKTFTQSGPMTHEFTHLVLDYMADGNYPRWFTEGMAQYAEYRINNYEWLTPDNDLRQRPLYTMQQLDGDFDALPNQALAYRESLAAVRYIAAVYGEDKLPAMVRELQHGRPLPATIKDVLGISYDAFAAAWPAWAETHMATTPDHDPRPD